jgi:acetolactate synthase-1/2/3 large subunit
LSGICTNSNQIKNEEESRLLKESSSYALIKLIREVIPEDTTIVCDLNIPSYWAEYYFPVFCQNSFLLPRGVSPIFYSLPASIGAKLGKPDKPCLAICGDGGVLPTIGELAVIQQYSIPVIIFIHNNSSFAILEDIMADRYGIHNSMKLFNPDFTKIARAFGIKAMQTDTLEGLEKIFRHYINWNKPFLIEFRHPVSPPPWKY